MRKTFLLLISIALVSYSYSQLITITEANQIPTIGESVTYQRASTFGFDPAGEGNVMDKTWDFAMLFDEGSEMTLSYVAVEDTENGAMFPNATFAEANSLEEGYFYYEIEDNSWRRWGFDLPSESMWGVYNHSVLEYKFPITAGQTFSTSYSGDFSPFGVGEDSVKINDGSLNINADAQGTLILPTGTFENVLRVRINETFKIDVYMMGMALVSQTVVDECYYWFHEDHMQPILMYYKTYLDGDLQDEVLRYQILDIEVEEALELVSAEGTDDQEVCLGQPIIDIVYLATGVSDADITGLPNGVAGVYSGNSITISGTPTETGVFDYLIELIGGEDDLTATGTIEIFDVPDVTCPSNITLNEDVPYQLTGASPEGGEYSGNGVDGGFFNPSGLANGDYEITYSYSDVETGCVVECTFTITVDISVSTDQYTSNEITVYPNPAKDEINILNADEFNIIKFYDITGREVKSIKNFNTRINISDLPSGLYVMELNSNTNRILKKIIVE